jgi:Flp pilus assembly protein TadD
LTQNPPAIIADNIKKDPVPIASFEKVLAAPNAITDTAPKIEQTPPENTTVQSVQVVRPVAAVQATPAVQPTSLIQTTPTIQSTPEIIAEPPIKNKPIIPSASFRAGAKPPPTKHITAKQQADLLYRQAENSAGDYSAVSRLEEALEIDPRHLKARLLLVKLLHNQGQVHKTAEILDQSLALFPDNLQFINTRAQLFLQQKNPGDALKTLQRIDLAGSSNDETYLSLLAASYQQLQSFTNAAKIYQRLATVNPEKAENWLGLALSEEKLGNSNLAREAYQQALIKNTLKESVVKYINQRLIELR